MPSAELRDGIAVQKGVVITKDFLEDNAELIAKWNNYFLLYPDHFLEITKSKNCPISLFYYQRIYLRATMRYRYHFGTFTRGTSKSFLAILGQYLACMFLPGSHRFLVSQIKKASLEITKAKLEEIWKWYPLLKEELLSTHMSTDYVELTFKNGSQFTILSLNASSRGGRMHGGVMEECALIDGDLLSSVIIPMMNVTRRLPNGLIDPDEPHQQQNYITSAGSKNTYAYERLIELLVMEVINPEDVFVWGASYELPVYYGLLDKKFLTEQKLSSTFSDDDFARESCSIWTGGSKESWFNPNKLIKCRKLMHCEREFNITAATPNDFYIISVDVARYGGNDTSVFVIRVTPRENGWYKRVVYTENITKSNFLTQTARIKELNKIYRPKEIVVDGNGLGAAIIDNMVVASVGKHGEIYDPLYIANDPDNYPIPKGHEKEAIVFNIKANSTMNSEIYSNLYVQINSGNVALLANERIVKEKLATTKKGQRMNLLAKEKFLLPYIMTSRLIDEINNLKLKMTGVAGQIAVEQISSRINKDRVSALGYGLYRIKYYEDKEVRRKKSNKGDLSKMTLFSSGKRRRG